MNKDEQHLTVPSQTSANIFESRDSLVFVTHPTFSANQWMLLPLPWLERIANLLRAAESLHHDLKGRASQTLHWFPKVLLPLLHCAKIIRQMEKESWGHSTIDHLAVVELHWTHLTIPLLELPVLESLSQTSELVSPAASVSYPSVATHVLDKHISQFVWQ